MKNSEKSQLAVLILLAIPIILSCAIALTRDYPFLFLSDIASLRVNGLNVITLFAIIYYIALSKKKIISIAISIVTIAIMFSVYFKAANYDIFNLSFWKLALFISIERPFYFFLPLLIFVPLLVSFIKSQIANAQNRKNNYAESNITRSSEIYCGLLGHILLLLFTFGIWHLIWIYRMTGYTNAAEEEKYRNPTKKLLLCMFIPFYSIYWTYKTAQRVDKMAAVKGIPSDMATLCLVLAIFVSVIPPILLQDQMNRIAIADDTKPVSNQKEATETGIDSADQIRKFKELLDSGAITQEEFNAKKRQLLGL